MHVHHFARMAACVAALALLAGCAPKSYSVRHPAPSEQLVFGTSAPATTLALVDARPGAGRAFSSGILPAALTVDGAPLDAAGYLASNLQAELVARGLPTQVDLGGTGLPTLELTAFRMQNHRANGFSPFVTLTFLGGELVTSEGKQRLGVFVKRGKVPVWSFDEVVEPTFNQPLSLAIKELAAKIAARLHGARSSDADVDRLVKKIATRGDDSYLDVYALGFTNNPTAIGPMAVLARDPDEYVRLAAISSLGTLGAVDQLELLTSIYRDGTLWQDRAMALKAIGDLDSPAADAFLAAEHAALEARAGDKEVDWTLQVVRLYR
ncbi:HEAT repeat domain-containing protein [Pseudoxanthomonas japonensis]|uniref:HEAT repeat domain-containing protein n=2 Tax=Pseudoxanthomonas TaxID=83618 RepID=A0ABQ6ZDJ9_9GAMM|nr:HEAT repeat domain-containing protein [Pseudoxanthomonas japonensis]KAF1723355.1 hypothetical protein CSC78_16310 [Pseudoxanthomonas japonensis]